MILCIYENREEALNLEPLSLTRPSFLLRCGSFSFLERIRNLLPGTRVALFVRDELASVTRERYGNLDINPESVTDALWLNGCVLWRKEDVDRMVEEVDTLFYRGDRLIGAHLTRQDGEQWLREGGPVRGVPDNSLSRVEIPVPVIRYLWDCVDMNGEAISGDSDSFHLGVQEGTVDGGAHLLNSSSIHVGEGSRVKQGAVLDAENGPILVGRDVTILPNAYLEGPLVIGDNSLVKAGARIYGGTTLGPGCKIGGEVTQSIFQSWSNKQHDGFIGHAYIGGWVNLGADTNNSDLKNNYSPVEVSVHGNVIDTGSLFVGLFVGDHTKTGINVMFNTGTSVGPASNIVGYGYPPKVVPSFSWWINGRLQTHQFRKFVQTARVVKERRGQSFSHHEELLYRYILDSQHPSG